MKRVCIVLAILSIVPWTACLFPNQALALGSCNPNPAAANNRYVAPVICGTGVDSTSMDAAFQIQQTAVWCWAASMSMILSFNGKPVSQQDIVADIFGATIPRALDPAHIGPYLNHTYQDHTTQQSATVSGTVLFNGRQGGSGAVLSVIIRQLRAGTPLLLFTTHHAMVMTAIYYYADYYGNPTGGVAGVVVRDPYPTQNTFNPGYITIPGHPGERVLTPQEYFSTEYVFLVTVS